VIPAAKDSTLGARAGTDRTAGSGLLAGQRLALLVEQHADFVWRSLRRMGVTETQADDATQEVFIVTSQKLERVEPGRERAFLYGVAMNVAAHARRSRARSREVSETEETLAAVDKAPNPEMRLADAQARALLDRVLETLPDELRAVFVLFELEEMPTAEIAALLEIPSGTVASRLRRAREEFELHVTRIKARRGGGQ